jgi:hypothetical protein
MPATPFAVFVASTLIIIGVFGGVALSTRQTHSVDYAKATRLRLVFLVALGGILITFLTLTLPHLPYSLDARAPDRIVHAVGKQYVWSLTKQAGPTLATWDRDFSPTVTVPPRSQIEFHPMMAHTAELEAEHGVSVGGPTP